MIVSDLENINHQVPMNLALVKAIEFLRLHDIHTLREGRVDIEGSRIFALIQRYETLNKQEPKFEAHRAYIDVQYMVSGEEIIGWAPLTMMSVTEQYDETKDICFGTVKGGAWTPVHMPAGRVAILYPEDAHAPKLALGVPSAVMKIVVKIAV